MGKTLWSFPERINLVHLWRIDPPLSSECALAAYIFAFLACTILWHVQRSWKIIALKQ